MDTQEEIRDRYASEARTYREDALIINFDAPNLYEKLYEILDLFYPNKKAELDILDIGAGNGMLTEVVYKKYPNANYTMLDFSKEMLDSSLICFEDDNVNIKVNRILSNFVTDDLPNKKYDLVISSYAIHHVREFSDLQHVYEKIEAVLKDKGLFICVDNYLGETEKERSRQLEIALDKWEESYKSRKKAIEWGNILETEDSPATINTIISLITKLTGTALLLNEPGTLATIYGFAKMTKEEVKAIGGSHLLPSKKHIVDKDKYLISKFAFSKISK